MENKALRFALIGLACFLATDSFAERKDFRGLFGSYRKEKFVENEANATDFGIDISLSTLFPVTSIVKSEEITPSGVGLPMYYASYFDYEASLFFTMNYHWLLSLTIGHFAYDTRKENGTLNGQENNFDQPLFHEFETWMAPVLLGVRYRFGVSDIVPFVGLGLGIAYTERKASYDYDVTGAYTQRSNFIAAVAQMMAGLEFYMTSHIGLRLEMSAIYVNAPLHALSPSPGSVAAYPKILAQANPFTVRYASGVFFLF